MNNDKDTVQGGELEQEAPKTYTQEDLDNSFNAGVRKANSDWQKDEKYKEFIAWKKSSQTENEKINELIQNNTTLANEKASLEKQIALLEAQAKVGSTDVKKEFARFVTSEVLEMVNDTTDFDTALKRYKKDNPQYFGEMQIKKTQTAPSLNSGVGRETTTNDIMNGLLRSSRQS